MILYCKDILYNIKNFLENRDIIELILCNKYINNNIGKKNTFTSLTINNKHNICDMIRLYLSNKISIKKVILIDIKNPICLWPFDSNTMIFIDCNVDETYVKNNYKTKNMLIINKKKYQHFWP